MSQQVGVFDSGGNFTVITIEGDTSHLPAGYYNSPAEAWGANHSAPSAPVYVAPPPPPVTSYSSPAFDINGTLVTIDLLGGDYANLPAGYYVTRAQASVARAQQQASAAAAPITAQQVAAIYANPDPVVQAAVQEIFNSPPPPSDYVAPLPPLAVGFQTPAVIPPPTPQQIIAQNYIDQGYTPPPAAVIDQIVSGAIVAPLTEPLTPAHVADPTPAIAAAAPTPPQNPVDASGLPVQTANTSPTTMTAVDYATQRPDLLVNWARAHNPAWAAANSTAAGVVQFINSFPNLLAYLQDDFGAAFSPGPAPSVPQDIVNLVASEVPKNMIATNEPPGPSQFFDPTHRSIGWGPDGKEYFTQIDEHGDVLTYASDGTNLQNRGQASMPAAATATALSQNYYRTNPRLSGNFGTVTQSGGGGGGVVDTHNGGTGTANVSPFFDPTHRSVGWGADGKERFIQIDEAGYILSYNSDGTYFMKVGLASTDAASTAAMILAQNPYKTNPLANAGGGGSTTTTLPVVKKDDTTTKLLLGAGVGLLIWKLSRA